MSIRIVRNVGRAILEEMKEFASFDSASQRYIASSLDVGLNRRDAVAQWSRSTEEAAAIVRQQESYSFLAHIRAALPIGLESASLPNVFSILVAVSARDLLEGRLDGFLAYRFLYERLCGSGIRPWLVPSFLAASALPAIPIPLRLRLLQTLSQAEALASHWPQDEPHFYPMWIDQD